jgi:putative hydrolase of the HAD superfamily
MVTLDALGTLVELEAPWEHLARELGRPPDPALVDAVRAEMRFYRDRAHTGRDRASLAKLRRDCAEVLSRELGQEVDADTMMRAIRFRAYPDAAPAMSALRERGIRLLCVSNWDCSLGEVLGRCNLRDGLEAVITSAETGARKPDPVIFERALETAGVEPAETLHVGDTFEEDVEGAHAAGIEALLLHRGGEGDIASLTELPELVASMGA